MMEDDILEMDDDCVKERGGSPKTSPPIDVKDGQDDQIEKDSCSSHQVALQEEHDERRRSSYPDHFVGDSPRYGGTTESVGTRTPLTLMISIDDKPIGSMARDNAMMSGLMDKVLDGWKSDERHVKYGCLDDVRCTVEEDTRPGDTVVMITPAMQQSASVWSPA